MATVQVVVRQEVHPAVEAGAFPFHLQAVAVVEAAGQRLRTQS